METPIGAIPTAMLGRTTVDDAAVVRVDYDNYASSEQYRRAAVRAVKGATRAEYRGMHEDAITGAFYGLYLVR